MTDAEQLRASLAASGAGLWGASPAQASRLLCAWNAFALQTLGDELVEADYRADPRTVGFLPPVTAEQAMRGRAEAALADFIRAEPPQGREGTAARLRGWAAEAGSVVAYGEALWSPDASAAVHERVENSLRRGIGAYYELGQLLAMPVLAERPQASAVPVAARPLPLPGQPGFDPWCLTDPHSRARWQQDPAARRAVMTLWRYDPDPAATLAVQSQIDAAVAAGAVAGETPRGHRHYNCCPWSSIYQVRQPVTIDGQQLRPMQEFTFDVSAEEMGEGGEFTRRLLPGPFHPATRIDYCDPSGDD